MLVVEPTASEEKLRELLREGHESSALDYKSTVDLSVSDEVVELVKDLAAMRAESLGGYIVVGADDHGNPTDGLIDDARATLFDEATLRAKVQRYLTEPLELMSGVHTVDSHRYALVYVGPSARGFEVLRVEGNRGRSTVFRPGEVFVRRGTASTRWNGAEADERLERFAAGRRETWRREMREDLSGILSAGQAAQRVSQGPADAFTWQLDAETFSAAAVELLRAGDDIPLRRLLLRAPAELADLTRQNDSADVETLLDRVTIVGALAIEYQRPEWLQAVVDSLMRAYEHGFAATTNVDAPGDASLWLKILTRTYGLGGLAVRLRQWWAVSDLATASPPRLEGDVYWQSWLRHAQVLASRAGLLDSQTGVLAQAHNEVRRLDSLHPDTTADDEQVLDSLCQFDLLAAVAVSAVRHVINSGSYYPNFAPYRTSRTSPAFKLLVDDGDVRRQIAGGLSDADLALVLKAEADMATREGRPFSGFQGIEDETVRRFVTDHLRGDYTDQRRDWDLG